MKKLINKVVNELSSLGLSPLVLQDLLENTDTAARSSKDKEKAAIGDEGLEGGSEETTPASSAAPVSNAVYEFSSTAEGIEPRLRLRLRSVGGFSEDEGEPGSVLWAIKQGKLEGDIGSKAAQLKRYSC